MRNVIVDASPIIFIAKDDLLDEFKKFAKNFYVTPWILSEIEYPIRHGIKAPEVEKINKANILTVEKLTAKEMREVNKIRKTYKQLGIGEAQAAVLWKRGNFDVVIVADIRAERILRNELKVNVMDVVDVGFELIRKGVNPLHFARMLWEKAHYRSERIKEILHRYR
jgi:predicted nucleic acid-binding protein